MQLLCKIMMSVLICDTKYITTNPTNHNYIATITTTWNTKTITTTYDDNNNK